MMHRPEKRLESAMKRKGFEFTETGGGFSAYIFQRPGSYQVWITKAVEDGAPTKYERQRVNVIVFDEWGNETFCVLEFPSAAVALRSLYTY